MSFNYVEGLFENEAIVWRIGITLFLWLIYSMKLGEPAFGKLIEIVGEKEGLKIAVWINNNVHSNGNTLPY